MSIFLGNKAPLYIIRAGSILEYDASQQTTTSDDLFYIQKGLETSSRKLYFILDKNMKDITLEHGWQYSIIEGCGCVDFRGYYYYLTLEKDKEEIKISYTSFCRANLLEIFNIVMYLSSRNLTSDEAKDWLRSKGFTTVFAK